MTTDDLIAAFLQTGDSDPNFIPSLGQSFVESEQALRVALLDALMAEVRNREANTTLPFLADAPDFGTLIRGKFEPMARGLSTRVEQGPVLDLLYSSVVFLTPSNIETVLRNSRWLSTTWELACLYLSSIGAEPLSDEAPDIVGLSEETTCYVSLAYFRAGNKFDDFVVHEAAHVFHNCKRETAGLPCTRWCDWLLEIEFSKRETFAYAVEAYSRIIALSRSREERRALLAELKAMPKPNDDRVNHAEYLVILSKYSATWDSANFVHADHDKF
ncbi:hypothetical protein [Methyloterricola oryzae]|uniref:hypothetical protein n=1 Tax=Methyloterricola oryzae TaxID=1495050 RepID=UPI0005EAE266|nr:hypothetical protein [Methyloterricola oryzae]